MRFLSIVRSDFNDVSIRDGTFRSYSYDKSYILETAFPFFRGIDFDITNVKRKYGLLNKFGKNENVTFTLLRDGYLFDNSITDYKFLHPSAESLDNKYIAYEDMANLILNKIYPEKLIVSDTISSRYVRRTKQAAKTLSSLSITFHINKKDPKLGELIIFGQPKTSEEFTEYTYKLKFPICMPFNRKHSFQLPSFPFKFDTDDLFFKSYFNYDKTITTFCNTKLDNLFVNFYAQSEILRKAVKAKKKRK
jgi:hypothetical protein